MKSRLAFLAVLFFAGFLSASRGGESQAADQFRGVEGVRPAEAGVGDTITVRLRDLDGWVLNEIKQKRITGEGYFTDAQFDAFFQRLLKAQSSGKDYGDLIEGDFEALQKQRIVVGKLNRDIAQLKDSGSRLDKSGAPAPAESPAAASGQPPVDAAKALKDLEAAQKRLTDEQAAFDRLESTWYSGWQAWQCWRALFRAVRENLYLVVNDSRLVHVKAQNPFNNGRDEPLTGVTIYDLEFALEQDPGDKTEWDKLYHGTQRLIPATVSLGFTLGGKSHTLDTLLRPASLDDGISGQDAFPGERKTFFKKFNFVTFGAMSMAAGLGLVILALLVFLRLACDTEMVRESSARPDMRPKFSLARCQTAFWFFLFTAAYVYLWVLKRQTDTLTEQCLVLLGISTGATIGSAFINRPVRSETYVGKLPPFSVTQFFNDLLSDSGGQIAFYRFQTLVWTLVLGLVFIKSVCFGLRMPEFGANELTLMGISAGTYIGFKLPERKDGGAAKDAAQTPPAATPRPDTATQSGGAP